MFKVIWHENLDNHHQLLLPEQPTAIKVTKEERAHSICYEENFLK
jgi:hypothetical protein